MRLQRRLFLFVSVLALLSALPSAARPRPILRSDLTPPVDVSTSSNSTDVRTVHLRLDLDVDFDAKRIHGVATHELVNPSGTDKLILDTRDLVIGNVMIDGEPATYALGETSRNGNALTIDIKPTTRVVTVSYDTTITNSGLVFMTRLQTFDDTDPFLYTFGQPDRTRDWIPIQDSPGVRMTYEATVRVPPGLMAVMSARNPTETSPDGTYHFDMPYPIPPYLIALAVGRLEFRPLDGRTGFYAEPQVVDDAAWDLQFIPEMLDVAEEVLGPYPFERYDVLLAPPGYAAGGMENPMLNFLGVLGAINFNHEEPVRRTYLVAHELAHSWAGDLATCATWNDTWLNEGFATYYGHRLLEEIVGPEQAELGFYWERDSFETYDENTQDRSRTILHQSLKPEETLAIFSPTSYSKGGIFLQMLDSRMGRDRFDELMHRWFGRHRFRWVDDIEFLAETRRMPDLDAEELQLEEWIYGTGLPSNVTAPTSSAIWERVAVQASRYRNGVPAMSLDTTGWTNQDVEYFLWQITDIVKTHMAELDAAFGLSNMKTPSIHWFLGVARTLYAPGLPMFERYLLLGGFNVISLYQTLVQTPAGLAYAEEIYERARPQYVPGIQTNVDQIMANAAKKLKHAA